MRPRDLLAAAAGALAATTIAGGVAWATIPGSDGTIQGCYLKTAGILRVIDPSKNQKCLDIETSISWNQKGQRGDPGSAGAPGGQGDKGDTGDKGDPCLVTNPACIGPKGEPGTNGTNGQPGASGKDGTNGKDGVNGQDGAACLPSNIACVGPPGKDGTPGVSGYETVTAGFTVAFGRRAAGEATCPTGKKPVGGGVLTGNATHMDSSVPTAAGWHGDVSADPDPNGEEGTRQFFVTAVCVAVT